MKYYCFCSHDIIQSFPFVLRSLRLKISHSVSCSDLLCLSPVFISTQVQIILHFCKLEEGSAGCNTDLKRCTPCRPDRLS